MDALGPGELLIGRAAERARLEANLAAGRHALLVGPIGSGKTHLLRAVVRDLPRVLGPESLRPLRTGLLRLGQQCHAQGWLRLPDAGDVQTLTWPECARRLGRLTVPELTDVLVASLKGRAAVLVLDELELATPTMLPALDRLLAVTVGLAATRALRPGLEKLWWAFDRIELPPLSREEARALLWTLADRTEVADPDLLEATVLGQAAGNPYAIREMVTQVTRAPEGGAAAIRELAHGAGLRYLDLTPALLLVGAGLVMARFVALGLDDRDLYILAGSLGAFFFVVRYLLARTGGTRS